MFCPFRAFCLPGSPSPVLSLSPPVLPLFFDFHGKLFPCFFGITPTPSLLASLPTGPFSWIVLRTLSRDVTALSKPIAFSCHDFYGTSHKYLFLTLLVLQRRRFALRKVWKSPEDGLLSFQVSWPLFFSHGEYFYQLCLKTYRYDREPLILKE